MFNVKFEVYWAKKLPFGNVTLAYTVSILASDAVKLMLTLSTPISAGLGPMDKLRAAEVVSIVKITERLSCVSTPSLRLIFKV